MIEALGLLLLFVIGVFFILLMSPFTVKQWENAAIMRTRAYVSKNGN